MSAVIWVGGVLLLIAIAHVSAARAVNRWKVGELEWAASWATGAVIALIGLSHVWGAL